MVNVSSMKSLTNVIRSRMKVLNSKFPLFILLIEEWLPEKHCLKSNNVTKWVMTLGEIDSFRYQLIDFVLGIVSGMTSMTSADL